MPEIATTHPAAKAGNRAIGRTISRAPTLIEAARKEGYLGKIKELSPSIDVIPSFLAFTKQRDYSEVVGSFDRALTSMKNDQSFRAIYEKYLGPTKSEP